VCAGGHEGFRSINSNSRERGLLTRRPLPLPAHAPSQCRSGHGHVHHAQPVDRGRDRGRSDDPQVHRLFATMAVRRVSGGEPVCLSHHQSGLSEIRGRSGRTRKPAVDSPLGRCRRALAWAIDGGLRLGCPWGTSESRRGDPGVV